jgi:hypothetical protein
MAEALNIEIDVHPRREDIKKEGEVMKGEEGTIRRTDLDHHRANHLHHLTHHHLEGHRADVQAVALYHQKAPEAAEKDDKLIF